jgi:hypothetical protein
MNNQINDAAISDTDLDAVSGGWGFFIVNATRPAVTTSTIPETNRGLGSQETGRRAL